MPLNDLEGHFCFPTTIPRETWHEFTNITRRAVPLCGSWASCVWLAVFSVTTYLQYKIRGCQANDQGFREFTNYGPIVLFYCLVRKLKLRLCYCWCFFAEAEKGIADG